MNDINTYITTPIYYLNGMPHLGHAYTTILGDILRRTFELRGENVFYTTGTDEHGQKNFDTIQKLNMTFEDYVKEYSQNFKNLFKKLGIDYDLFVQTSCPHHTKIVKQCLQRVYDNGLIIKKKYTGLYCKGCEQFKKESDLDENGCCPYHQEQPVEISEENYFLPLEPYREWLKEYIENNPDWIQPSSFRTEILNMLKQPLEDLCISRPKNRVHLGVEIPFDTDYITYIWFDALINYISSLDWPNNDTNMCKFWPNSIHIMAKDIIKPHCIYWPIMLKALGLLPPHRIMIHGFLVGEGGVKMSKSLGNVIDPEEMVDKIGADAFRFVLVNLMNKNSDTQVSENIIFNAYNRLANTFGNLYFRTCKLIEKFNEGIIPDSVLDSSDMQFVLSMAEKLKSVLLDTKNIYDIQSNTEVIFDISSKLNYYIDQKQPWNLAKDEARHDELLSTLYVLSEGVRMLGIAISPIMPSVSQKILTSLSFDMRESSIENMFTINTTKFRKIQAPEILFPRLCDKDTQAN